MARPLRIEYPGAYYHIIQRGIDRKDIFSRENDKERFLLYLTLAHKGYSAIIHSYVLMKNHYHLILETPKGNLTKIMHYINTSYAAYFNSKYKRVGPLYQGRYKSILVQHDEYLHTLSRYIHLNPVRIKIVKDPKDYKWSSYKYFISSSPAPEFLNTNFILSMFDKNILKAKGLYEEFVLEGIAQKDEIIKNNTRKGFILGNDDFFKRIKEEFIDKHSDYEIPLLSEFKRESEVNIQETIRSLAEHKIGKDVKLKRKVMIYLTRRYTQKTLKEIASLYGNICYTGISQICRRIEKERNQDRKVGQLLEEMEREIAEKV